MNDAVVVQSVLERGNKRHVIVGAPLFTPLQSGKEGRLDKTGSCTSPPGVYLRSVPYTINA